jgi:colanic acid/amylovoran biosynthesis glycosyltransferase
MYRALFCNGERFLAISQHGAATLRELGAPAERVSVHHMGIDVEKFCAPVRPRSPCSKLRVLSVGRLVAKKGFHHGIEAVAAALRNNVPIEYRIIGAGPKRAFLAALTRKLGVDSAVRLVGPAGEDAVLEAMHESDLLLVPSVTAPDGDEEGVPMVLMEAQAAGLPAIATRHGGIPELVENERSGLLVPEADRTAIAVALQRLARDPELRQWMGKYGRDRVVREFNLQIQNTRLEQLLAVTAREYTQSRIDAQMV